MVVERPLHSDEWVGGLDICRSEEEKYEDAREQREYMTGAREKGEPGGIKGSEK